MEERKKNNKTYLLISLGVIGALIITLGITYAYWRLTKEQTGVNVVNTDCFSIDFTGENDITLNKAYPLEDAELESFLSSATPYHFTITNHCSSLASATINLESLNASPDKQLDDEWVDAILYETDYHKKLNKSFKLTGNPNNDANKVIADALHAYSLKNFTLKANEVKDYYLLLYMDQETPLREDTQNATWKGKITLSTEYKVDQFANSGTLRQVYYNDTNGMWNYKDKLTKIVIETKKSEKEVSEGQTVYGPFNEGVAGSTDAIQSYVVCEAEDMNCIGYLQGDGGIKLNNNSSHLFDNFKNVTEIDGIKNLESSSVTNMGSMFYGMSSLQELDLSNFDTSNVKDMSYMFQNCSQLQKLDLSSFDTSNVKYMSYMFNGMSNLTSLTFEDNFDTSNVTTMESMFRNCSQLQELDLSSFDTSSVTNMTAMFSGMSQIKELDLSKLNTSSVTDMTSMFLGMSSIQELDLSNFDTSSVKSMAKMFKGMSSIQELDLSGFDTSSVTNMNSMFDGMMKMQSIDLSSFDTSNVKYMSNMFQGMSQLQTLTFGENFNTGSVTAMSYMFNGMSSLQELDLSSFDTSSVENMSNMFNGMSNLTTLTLGNNFITSSVTNMNSMFSDMSQLQELDLSGFDTSSVANMSYMFNRMSSLQELDLSTFDTSSVENMSNMFSYMSNLTTLTLGNNFITSSVTNMNWMFSGMSQLQELDLSGFDTSSVTNMSFMFFNDNNLVKITYGTNFIHNAEANINNMFYLCNANKPDVNVHSSWEGVTF